MRVIELIDKLKEMDPTKDIAFTSKSYDNEGNIVWCEQDFIELEEDEHDTNLVWFKLKEW